MADQNYNIPENPEYNPEIRKLQDSDPASASETFNPLFERLIENTAAVKGSVEQLEETAGDLEAEKGQPGGLATLDDSGKIPAEQLPPMDYDQAGAAAAVQTDLNSHKADTSLHVTAEKQSKWDTGAQTATEAKEAAAAAQITADAANSKAQDAQKTADQAMTDAAAAQTTAEKAVEQAQRKAPEIVEIKSSMIYTVPAGVCSIDAYLIGGGDGGGDGRVAASNGGDGGQASGGFGGRILYAPGLAVTAGEKMIALIGAGGDGARVSFGGNTEFGPFSTALSTHYDINTMHATRTVDSMVYRTSLPCTNLHSDNSATNNTINVISGLNVCPINGQVYGIAGVAGGRVNVMEGPNSGGKVGCGIDMTIGGITIKRSGGQRVGWRGGGGASADADGCDALDGISGDGGHAAPNTGNGGGGAGGTSGSGQGGAGGNGGSGIIVLRLHYQ